MTERHVTRAADMLGAMQQATPQRPDDLDPRKFLAAALVAARDLCADRFEAFGCAGMASRLVQ